jgi:hypothetical protein
MEYLLDTGGGQALILGLENKKSSHEGCSLLVMGGAGSRRAYA